jgi:hypothetical protein
MLNKIGVYEKKETKPIVEPRSTRQFPEFLTLIRVFTFDNNLQKNGQLSEMVSVVEWGLMPLKSFL